MEVFEGGTAASVAGRIGEAVIVMSLIAFLTWRTARRGAARDSGSARDIYLAGGGLSWLFVAGSITLTNLSTEQLVGMNGNQMLLLAWWELAGFAGLLILAFVFVPVYYRLGCTTVTQLLEQRYGGGSIRVLISSLFLGGNILIYLPAALYSGSLFLKFMLGREIGEGDRSGNEQPAQSTPGEIDVARGSAVACRPAAGRAPGQESDQAHDNHSNADTPGYTGGCATLKNPHPRLHLRLLYLSLIDI